MAPSPELGVYGARVLRPISVGGVTHYTGTVLDAATVLAWPHQNRRAFKNLGLVEFFNNGPTEAPAKKRATLTLGDSK